MKHLLTFLRHGVSGTLASTVGSPSVDRLYSRLKHLAFMLLFLLGSLNVWGGEVTISYSGSSTTNMTGNNDAATVGLNATSWSVIGAKGGNSNFPGLNKSGYIAVYYNATASNTITVTNLDGATINSITITYTSNSYNNGVIKVGSNTISPSNGVYTINSSSFSITNGNTSNVQVRISSIAITYTPSGSGSSNPTVSANPTSLTFDAAEVGGSAPSAKTFTISGSNLTSALTVASSNTNLYACAVTSGSLTPSSKSVTATITVTPQAAITESAGTKEANIVISGGGLTSSVNVALSTTVTAPAHVYTYNKAFTSTTIPDWSSSWDNGYSTAHTVNFDIYNEHAGNDCHVYFAGASKQTTTITDKPVAKNGAVNLILDDPNKYISAVKFVGEQWGTKAQTMVLKYSTDGGESWTAFDPAKEATNFVIEELNLPAKVNAVQVAGKNSSNQIGYASVHFDLVDKVSYNINKSETGCTLSVTNGTSAITTAEAGDEVHVSIASTETGYENASFVVKDADNADVTVTNGKFTMPDKNVTITATATKKTYTVTLSAANGKIQVGGVDKESITVAHGETAELTADPNTDFAFNGWTSSDGTKVALSGANDNPVTITVTGAATVTASFISSALNDPELSWSSNTATVVKGQTPYSLPSLTNEHGLTIAYESSNTDVAEIAANGAVTIKGVGETTITASNEEEGGYAESSKSYTLTVKGRVTWHAKKAGVDATTYADYVKDAVPTKPIGDFIASCHSSISLVGWTTEDYKDYSDDDDAPAELYTASEDMPGVTDNVDYYAVWGVVEEGGWNEITAVANLTAGTYAIYANGYFLKAEIISGKNRFANGGDGTNVVSENKLTVTPAAACQWTLSTNAGGKFLFRNGDNYAAAIENTKNTAALTDDPTSNVAQWIITRPASDFVVQNVGRAASSSDNGNAYLRFNGGTIGWASYSSTQGDAPRFFKYSAGSTTGYTTNCVEPLTVATPTFTPNGSAAYYTEAQNVTVSCSTEGSVIYYTLDNTTPSKTNGTQYTTAINVAETKTIKAIAYVGDVASEVAEATFTINMPLTTIQGIFDEATAIGGTAQARTITFDNWIVSAISSDDKSVYVTDNTKGFVIYVSGKDHGFAVGDVLSGTVECDLQLFAGFAEIKDLKASNTSLTVTTGGVLVPADAEIKNLGAINTGAPVILSNVTYDSDGDLVDDESYYATPVEWLYTFETSTFETNKIYKVTGIYIYGSTSDKIVPRDAGDIVKLTKEQQTITWYVDNNKAETIGTSYSLDNKDVAFAPVCESNSTGAKTYQSSDPTVATINENTGVIEVLGNGVTTITCNVVGDENYVDGSKAFTLKVGLGEASWVATTWADENGVGDSQSLAMTENAAGDNVDMTWDKGTNNNAPKYYDNGKATRIYAGNTLTLTSKNGKIMTSITFTFSVGAFGANVQSVGDYNTTNNQWTGFANSVTFTSDGSWRITQIDIEYMNGTTTTLTIADMIILDNASATDIVFSSNKPGAVVVYSDYDDEVITIADGKVTPVAKGNTTVKASIAAEAPYSSVSITFNVRVKSSSETVENVVILSQFGEGWIAMKHDFTAVEVEKAADGTILDLTCDEEDITWVMTADGTSAMFQQPSTNKYLAVGSSNALVLSDDATVWTLSGDGYYYNVSGRTFLYQGAGTKYKNYSAGNAGKATDGGYSQLASFVAPVFANRADLRSVTNGQWGTYCPDHEVKYVEGASFYTIAYVEKQGEVPYKVFYDEIGEGESLQAGHPYIFIADEDATAIKGVKVGDAATEGINDNGFIGKLSQYDFYVSAEASNAYKYYIVYGNEIRRCGEGWFRISAERAYLDMTAGINTVANAPAAGRRRVCLTNQEVQIATGVDQVQSDQVQSTKVLINGELFILRGEKMYDATGRLVK